MKTFLEVRGAEKVIGNFKRYAAKIDKNSPNAVRDSARVGQRLAKGLAPVYTGETRNAILSFPKRKEVWIIQSNAPKDHPDFPVNVYFDTGTYPNPRNPATLGFMKKTTLHLQNELGKRLDLEIKRSLK